MIAALALIALVPQDVPPEALSEEEIVVIGRRLDGITVNVGRDAKGRWQCSLSGSTGKPKLDDRLCRATTKCVRKGKSDDAAVKACVARAKPSLMAELRKAMKR